jgi:hypothetical protein
VKTEVKHSAVDAEAGRPPERVPAIVLFAGSTQLKWLRFLKPGFRHCLIAVRLGNAWVIIDPLSHKTALNVVEGFSADELSGWYESQGLKAVRTFVREAPPKVAPMAPATCVEAVKRILGIHAWSIMTPRQLYDYLTAFRNVSFR